MALAFIAPLLLAGCTNYGGGTGGGTGGGATGGQNASFTITAGNLHFAPDTISVKAGDHVRLTVVNQDVFHTLTIDELGVSCNLPAGQTTTCDFTASQGGTFAFYCAVPGHKDAGMHGTLKAS